jgi:aminopeptidase N
MGSGFAAMAQQVPNEERGFAINVEKAGAFGFDRENTPLYVGPQPFDVLHYKIDLSLAMTSELLQGVSSITMVLRTASDSIRLNAAALQLDTVRVDGVQRAVRIDSAGEAFVVPLGGVRNPGDTLRIDISYRRLPGVKRPVTRLGYYYYTPATAQGIPEILGYTMSEPSDARFWLPCYDEPWDKATAEINATVPQGYTAASNGRLLGITANAGGTTTWRWREDHQVATYLLCVTASKFTISSLPLVRAAGDTIPVQYVVWAADSAATAAYLPTVRQMIVNLGALYGAYPFDKYGMTAVFPFGYGGMEHQTLTTLQRSAATNELVVVHELGHQWWGDLVTCGTWKDIWLNESFATYAEALWRESVGGKTALRNIMQSKARFADGSWQSAVYDPEGQGKYLFSDLVYDKGGWVLHALRGVLGDSLFFRALRFYRQQYAGTSAITREFQAAVEAVAGSSLNWFFDEWIFGGGWPVYAWTSSWSSEGLSVRIVQQQSTLWPTYTMPIQIRAYWQGKDTTFILWDSLRTQSWKLPLAFKPDSVAFDPDSWILRQMGTALSVRQEAAIGPQTFSLEQNYPNPFNPTTSIRFSVPRAQMRRLVTLEVFDILGRSVETLVNEELEPGSYLATFDASGRSSGVYYYRLRAGESFSTKRMVLLK